MWSKDNIENPRFVFKRTPGKKYFFECKEKHKFMCRPVKIDLAEVCPMCRTKTESKLFEWLKKNLTFSIESQKRFDWCRNPLTTRYLPFDFYIEDLNLIIELDGGQHFKQVWNWNSPDNQRKSDIYKMSKGLENDISIIRVFQENVWSNANNWEVELKDAIKPYDIPTVIYLGDKYKLHKDDMIKMQYAMNELDFEDDNEFIEVNSSPLKCSDI